MIELYDLNRLKTILETNHLKLAVAESLTAGKISERICSVPGISKYYQGGVTVYTNQIKNKVLGVDKDFLDKNGAYNFETTRMMCLGVMKLYDADCAIAVSGVSGPGPDDGHPQGEVFMTIAYDNELYDVKLTSDEPEREDVRNYTAISALNTFIDIADNKEIFKNLKYKYGGEQ